MMTDERIKDEKLQHDTNREAAKVLVLSSGKVNQYKYFSMQTNITF